MLYQGISLKGRFKMKMKKLLALLLAGIMTATMASCAGNGETSSASSEAGSSTGGSSSSEGSVPQVEGGESSEYGTLIAATDPSQLPAAATERKDTLIVGSADMTGVFNPFYWESNEDFRVVSMITASLGVSDDKGEITDGTAKMTVSEDGKVYTFKLTKEKYNDGSDVKPEDYVNYFKILADKSYDGYSDISPVGIVGFQDYYDGKTDEISGIKVIGDDTIEITLEAPYASAPYMLASAIPVSTEKYGDLIKHGDLSGFKALDMIDFVGNGAYVLKEYKVKASATLEANEYFYLGKPKVPTIIVKVVATNAEMQAVATGDVDLEEDVVCENDYIEEGKSYGFINMWVQETLGYGYVAVNHKLEKFQDPKVRQALLYAIDRKSLNNVIYGQYANALNIPQARVSWLYNDEGLNTYDYDLEKAAQLLEEAGWKKEGDKLMKDGEQFTIMFTAMSDNAVTQKLIPMMIDAYGELGIEVKAEYVDWPTLQDKSQKGTAEMYFMAWGLTADPDISGTYASPEAGGGQNHIGYSNKELDKLLAKAQTEIDREAIMEDYKEIYKIWNEDLPVFPIYQRSDLICYNTRVKNLVSSPYVKWYQQDKIGSIELG